MVISSMMEKITLVAIKSRFVHTKVGDGDSFKGCARPSHPGRGRQARSFDRFEDIHIVRLAQHGCSPRLDACIAARVRNVPTGGQNI